MFFIDKDLDCPFWRKWFNLIRVDGNILYLPLDSTFSNSNHFCFKNYIYKNNSNLLGTNKRIEVLAKKVNSYIEKSFLSKKIVLSKSMKNEALFVNYLNSFGYEIADGKWLSDVLLSDIVDKIVIDNNLKKVNISVMVNDLTDFNFQNIKILAKKYNSVNVVTSHIEKFKNLENELQNEGCMLTLINNKKKSLINSQIVINLDFPNELFNRYKLNSGAFIISIKIPLKIKQKRFNGKLISDYEITYKPDIYDDKFFNGNYSLKDLYEAQIRSRSSFLNLRNDVKNKNVEIVL